MSEIMLYVYDPSGKQIGSIVSVSSVQWLDLYYETGEFEVHAKATPSNIAIMVEGNRIYNSDTKTLGFIKYVLDDDGEIEVRGYTNNLNDRVNIQTAQIKKVPEDLIKLVNDNKRGLDINVEPNLELVPKDVTVETTWNELGYTISEVCKKTGIGYRMVKKGKQLNVLEFYEGKNTNCIFSPEIGNAEIDELYLDASNYKNYAYVAGEGEGAKRKIVIVDKSNGNPKHELYIDARELQSKYTDSNNQEHQYTPEEYEKVLYAKGDRELSEHNKEISYKFQILLKNRTFVYGKDYFLGDIVYLKSAKYGVSSKLRLVGIKTVKEKDYKKIGIVEEIL